MRTKPQLTDQQRKPTLGVASPEPAVATSSSPDEAGASLSQMRWATPATGGVSSTVHFVVHAAMPEVQAYAHSRGWPERGYSVLSTPWQELHWSTDGWKSTHVLKSTDVPSPVVNGYFVLAGVSPGTEVEFAIQVGVACHAPHDTAGARDVGEVWLNNGGANYLQRSR